MLTAVPPRRKIAACMRQLLFALSYIGRLRESVGRRFLVRLISLALSAVQPAGFAREPRKRQLLDVNFPYKSSIHKG